MRVEATKKIRGYTGYLVGEEHRGCNGHIYQTLYRYDCPENIAAELIELGAAPCPPPSRRRDDKAGLAGFDSLPAPDEPERRGGSLI